MNVSAPAWDRHLKPKLIAVVRLARRMVSEWRDDRVGGLAAEIAFFGLLGLFPALLAATAALGSLQSILGQDIADRAQREVVSFLEQVLTSRASGTIDEVRELFRASDSGAFTIGTVLSLWASSRAFVATINALNIAYDLEERRSYVHRRALALLLAVGTVVVFAVVMAAFVVGPLLGTGRAVAEQIGMGDAFATMWDWFRWPVTFGLILLWTATIFHFGCARSRRWRLDLPGAVLTTVLWIVVSFGLRLYLALAAGANQVLGVLGGLLILVIWLYLVGVSLLFGAELNSILSERRQPGRLPLPESPGRTSERGLNAR